MTRLTASARGRRLAMAAVCGAVVCVTGGCGSAPSPEPDVGPPPATSAPHQPRIPRTTGPEGYQPPPDEVEVASPPGDAVPPELVGTWVSTGGGDAEMIYVFEADGAYRYAGVLTQERPSGLFSFEVGAAGTVEVADERLILYPRSSTQTLKDPDSATGGWQKAGSTEPETFGWAVDGSHLMLTDAQGLTVTYRQE